MSDREDRGALPVVIVSGLDPEFAGKVIRMTGGAQIRRCFACGTCTAGCPVREANPVYNPCRILRMVLLGMKEDVLRSDFVWLCANCQTCRERCPQGVPVSEVMRVLKNIAVEEGIVHPSYKLQVELLRRHGRLYEIEDFDNTRRVRAGLAPLATRLEDVKLLMDKGGVLDKVK